MAGDSIVPDPFFTVTHAITIDAPPDQVWPWLAQLGSTRAGWYSYDWIDNGGRRSEEHVRPDLQDIRPGDVLPALPGATAAFVVDVVDPPRDLILTVPGDDAPVVSWEHCIEALGPARSRLIVRGRVTRAWKAMARGTRTAGERPVLIERIYRLLGRLPDAWLRVIAGLGHRWMEARHMRGIKRRAEKGVLTAASRTTRAVTPWVQSWAASWAHGEQSWC